METKKIAFFDFDGTLIRKDSFIQFAIFAVGKRRFIKALLKNALSLAAWKLGWISNYQAKEKLFSTLYKGMHIKDFNEICYKFANSLDGWINEETFKSLTWHIQQGHDICIVSASMENWIMPWAQKHGIKNIVATKIQVKDDLSISGRFLTANCYGKEKLNRLRINYKDLDSYEIWAYGDSKGDDDVLNIANHPHFIG